MKIIDPHIHLFNLEQGDYHWLKAENPPFWPDKSIINKTFKASDLTLSAPLKLAGFVHIEAGFDNIQPWRELAFIEEMSVEKTCNIACKTIAAIELTLSSHKFKRCLEKVSAFNSFAGVRHILDKQALSLLTDKQVLSNFTLLNKFAMNFAQNLIFETQLAMTDHAAVNALCQVIRANPKLNFIINHGGFPPEDSQTQEFEHWQSNLQKIASLPNTAIKCSGWEMIDRNYPIAWVNKSLTLIINIFGAKKVMLSSNFPLCLLSKKSYQEYWQSIITSDFFQALSEQEKNALCYDNALRWYSL
ncbi:MAG: amidohydrolase family protein [Colwellia sp.]|nr:amidohydrolase family protein [Colwellia sp.]MCW8863980.1 amidohydrolase family protein [Colwellia sp.]MCW9080081.1 amidohydrolase family protein [Colwellia sp.]